jgi:hypothetical protein
VVHHEFGKHHVFYVCNGKPEFGEAKGFDANGQVEKVARKWIMDLA